MNKPVPFLLQGKNIILVIDGKSHTISKDTHMNYAKIVEALKAKDWGNLRDLVEPLKSIVNFGKGYVSIENGIVYWKGNVFNNALSTRMIDMYNEGFPIDPMIAFMENLMSNPSKRSVDQLYGFLEKNSLPITEDGHFLAYKKVTHDYKDIHTRNIDNSIGQIVEMERNLVDDNPESYCSSGLHFCSISYLSNFGGMSDPIMILKINPADVVSIPDDYNGAKGRCMRYEVVGEVKGDPATAFTSVVDKTYTGQRVDLDTKSSWPFPTTGMAEASEAVEAENSQQIWPTPASWPKTSATAAGSVLSYSVYRKYTGVQVASGLTLHAASKMVATAIRQKKAVLQIKNSAGKIVGN